jgi:hypothetical protein
MGGVQEFHTGGIVQGDFPGQQVPVLARAGEPFGSAAPTNGHGGQMIHNVIQIDGRKFYEEIVLPHQVRYEKRNGSR